MSDKKIQIIRLRMNRERNIWDRQILEWLETLPLGYRTKSIKEVRVRHISKQGRGELGGESFRQESPYIEKKLGSLFKETEDDQRI